MVKTIECPECKGKGYIKHYLDISAWKVRCSHCDGSGKVTVPMTNADRIRNINDEELAKFLLMEVSNDKCYGICHGSCTGNDCISGIVKWLNSEYKEK